MKKFHYLYLAHFAIMSLLLAGCTKTSSTAQVTDPKQANVTQETTQPSNNAGETHAHDEGHGSKLAGSRIDLRNVGSLKPGEVALAFKLYGIDAHEFGPDDLNVAHEKLVHLILVRDDATGFQHIHPEYTNGRWTVKTAISEPGQYNIYVDVSPKEEPRTILRVPITIGGPTVEPQYPAVSANRTVTQDGINAALNSAVFKAAEHSKLIFSLTRNGEPVSQIDPYLGAFGHVVVLRHGDPDDYLHAHPITETKPSEGKVEFESEYPATGRYTIFAQFNIGGDVKTFPITLDVDQKGQAPVHNESEAVDSTSGHNE